MIKLVVDQKKQGGPKNQYPEHFHERVSDNDGEALEELQYRLLREWRPLVRLMRRKLNLFPLHRNTGVMTGSH
jgi:hypothetical protein